MAPNWMFPVRLVPRDALRYAPLKRQLTITDMEQLPLHLVGTLPQSADKGSSGASPTVVIFDPRSPGACRSKRFNRNLTPPDEETRAYALSVARGDDCAQCKCPTTRDYQRYSPFPLPRPELITLAGFTIVDQQPATPTISSATVPAQLALHLFYKGVRQTAGRKPTAAQFVEFCRGMVAGRYLWAVDGVDGKIADAARPQAQLSGLVAAPDTRRQSRLNGKRLDQSPMRRASARRKPAPVPPSSFTIVIMASITAFTFLGSLSRISSVNRRGTICHERPNGSLVSRTRWVSRRLHQLVPVVIHFHLIHAVHVERNASGEAEVRTTVVAHELLAPQPRTRRN